MLTVEVSTYLLSYETMYYYVLTRTYVRSSSPDTSGQGMWRGRGAKLELSPSPGIGIHRKHFCDDYPGNRHIVVIEDALQCVHHKLQEIVNVLLPWEGMGRLCKYSAAALLDQIPPAPGNDKDCSERDGLIAGKVGNG